MKAELLWGHEKEDIEVEIVGCCPGAHQFSTSIAISRPKQKGHYQIELDRLFDEFFHSRSHELDAIKDIYEILQKHLIFCEKLIDRNIESPIEQIFWQAVQQELEQHYDKILKGLLSGKNSLTYLTYQFPIKNYRVDFAIPEKRVVIELDGHDYHKTKEQRTHDAKRERDLQEWGWTVIRFTGSEVYRDVKGCIKQVKRIITKK